MWAVLFYCCAGVILFTYAGYPVLLYLLSFFKRGANKVVPVTLPSVTIIIAAYNEEKVIEAKLRNSFQLGYPADKLQLIVAAYGSDDDTVRIASSFSDVLVLHEAERKGKAAAVNKAVAYATNDIIVLTDANSILSPQTINQLVLPFAEQEVGAVAGEKKVVSADGAVAAGEGLYWQYESWLKKQERKFYTVVGAAGELFAFRKELFVTIPGQTITDDFFLSVSINLQHKKMAYVPEAISSETASLSLNDEWNRKVRIAAGGIQSLFLLRAALNPFRYPALAFQFFCHRVLRWVACAPAFIFLLLTNMVLAFQEGSMLCKLLLLLQVLFYVSALAGWRMAKQQRSFLLFTVPFYIVFMHAAMLMGMLRYASGKQSVLWEKAKR
jgi:poly-beta-1,6-N-acetyl-D-glucosamine synthase